MGQAPVTQTITRTARRRFLSALSSLAMLAGLVGGYGAFAALAGRFLYPVRSGSENWLFVAPANRLKQGDNLRYHAPADRNRCHPARLCGLSPDRSPGVCPQPPRYRRADSGVARQFSGRDSRGLPRAI